jgi:hypothetical protein
LIFPFYVGHLTTSSSSSVSSHVLPLFCVISFLTCCFYLCHYSLEHFSFTLTFKTFFGISLHSFLKHTHTILFFYLLISHPVYLSSNCL